MHSGSGAILPRSYKNHLHNPNYCEFDWSDLGQHQCGKHSLPAAAALLGNIWWRPFSRTGGAFVFLIFVLHNALQRQCNMCKVRCSIRNCWTQRLRMSRRSTISPDCRECGPNVRMIFMLLTPTVLQS